jgi:hypothetical protein
MNGTRQGENMERYDSGFRTERKILIPDYTKLHLQMLVYKSMGHYNTWVVIGENISDGEREEFLKERANIVPIEFLEPPKIMDSFNFTELDLVELKQKYILYDWEKSAGKCPFCRITPSARLMRVLSRNVPEGSLKRGGATTHCIHLLWDDKFEVVSLNEWIALGV